MASSIHPTALVHPSVKLGEEVEIGPYCIVGPQVAIGSGTRLLARVSLVEETILGAGNVVHAGAVLGGDPQDRKFNGEETWLHIGDGNTIRECVTINRGTGHGGGHTRIGNHCLIMAGCHIAHDCTLGDHVTMANNVLFGGHVDVGDHAGFGGMTAVHHFVTVGCHAFVGGATRLNKDAPPYLIIEGHPARVRATNRVGLERHGISEETRRWLKEAQRLLYIENLPREQALRQLSAGGRMPAEGRILFEFLEQSDNGRQGRGRQP